jgi:hypothetical protein
MYVHTYMYTYVYDVWAISSFQSLRTAAGISPTPAGECIYFLLTHDAQGSIPRDGPTTLDHERTAAALDSSVDGFQGYRQVQT